MTARLRLLIVDDEPLFLETLERLFRREGVAVRTAADGEAGLARLDDGPADVVLADVAMPAMGGIEFLRRVRARRDPPEVVMLTGHGTIETAVEAMKLGAYDYLQKPAEVPDVERVVRKAWEKARLARENRDLQRRLHRHDPYREVVGGSAAMQALRETIDRVAPAETTVLVLGESGAGKELVARLVHQRSARAEGPFLTLHCGILQPSLLENELFGHVAGAYTGATADAEGLFEAAGGGTLLVDEVGEMDLAIQRAFLRVLETGEYKRVGEARLRHADARIIAATNRDLEADVQTGRFRLDLFYRLGVFTIRVPPLREHPEDVPDLVRHLLGALEPDREPPRAVEPAALKALERHPWPGNVRELRNSVERALINARGTTIGLADLGPFAPGGTEAGPGPSAEPPTGPPRVRTLDELERQEILRALDTAGGNKTRAAGLLGVSLRSLYTRMDRHRIPR